MITEKDRKYMRMAMVWAENSHAERNKVGALIVKNNAIISDGYNGTPSGFDNVCEYKCYEYVPGCGEAISKKCNRGIDLTCKDCGNALKKESGLRTKPEVLHAEANAITKLAKSTNSSEGADLYVTVSPCFECSKLIIQSGIRRVVFLEKYRLSDGLDLLTKAGIVVEQIEKGLIAHESV